MSSAGFYRASVYSSEPLLLLRGFTLIPLPLGAAAFVQKGQGNTEETNATPGQFYP